MGTPQDCPWSLDTVPVRGKKDDISEVPLVLYVVEDAAKPLLNCIIPDFITTMDEECMSIYSIGLRN